MTDTAGLGKLWISVALVLFGLGSFVGGTAAERSSDQHPEGPVRVTDTTERLAVSHSTAHRLLAVLVYRDFAEQTPDRRYRADKVLRPAKMSEAPVMLLRRVALPHLQRLVGETQESANVMVLAGTEVRFIATVECHQILRVGDRVGRSLPAHMASGRKTILAALPPDQLTALYDNVDGIELPPLKLKLTLARKRGFAIPTSTPRPA
ncbi:helix-turn-helix domain-containing protein [Streptomyces sp. NBC_00893]|uniref:IclR family transcriptional regulator domain-containing protein n=1 Tax=Streptomyces sp. NBC_00893 TaxID=2975862 RepID=UPI0022572153|nr:helix-turn-helix domain-containing protein [Streptomyces sp. NBC_00893]MCX4850671.1 helix-turn-helix domain-containing protein [Streptomyces sp. NBC_00893]